MGKTTEKSAIEDDFYPDVPAVLINQAPEADVQKAESDLEKFAEARVPEDQIGSVNGLILPSLVWKIHEHYRQQSTGVDRYRHGY